MVATRSMVEMARQNTRAHRNRNGPRGHAPRMPDAGLDAHGRIIG